MAVIHCKEVTNRAGNEDGEQNANDRVRTFQLLCDTATDGVGIVLAHAELPILYDEWESVDADDIVTDVDPDIICVHRSAEQNDPNDLHNWTATFRYAGTDPITLPAEVESDQVDYQKHLIDDVKDRPIVNKAGDPFEEGAVVDRSRGLIRITKNLDEWNAVEMEAFRDTLNDNIMWAAQWAPGYAVGTLKMRSLTAKRIPYPGNQAFYWRATAVIESNLDGWLIKLRNQGRRCRTAIDGPANRTPFLNGGVTNKGQFLLTEDGLELPVGDDPNVCEFDGYDKVDWSGLTWLEF